MGTAKTRLDAAGAVAATAREPIDDVPIDPGFVPGQRVRQYEIIRELGRGGMGRVMLARDTRLGRRVAMKFLTSASRELTSRFLAEARVTAGVNHENIVVIHEIDELDGVPYMVLEYLEGATLRDLLAGARVPIGRAVEIAVRIVRALVRAHEAGIVHRDLKPENVFVTDGGNIKVLDFGIAKLLSERKQQRLASASELQLDPAVTSHGMLLGTLPYMSPEQLGADEIDHRSDLWAMGILLFEMVAGGHPLELHSVTALLGQVCDLDEPMPPIANRVPEAPVALERIIERCLAKRKAERYPTARALLDDLEALAPRQTRQIAAHESPYPGLSTFQESDADRFFGREEDVQRVIARVRDQALVGVVGPSGVGKSSFVRAGVVPALKASGEAWEVHVLRPGRQPLASLASAIATTEQNARVELAQRLAREPGYFGSVLRERAARKQTKILLFIDQFEELYTQTADLAERLAYTACLTAASDDSAAPVRIVVSMRSDLLDRAGEDVRFLDELTRGLVFLQPLGSAALRQALVQPLEARGFRFETREMVDEMLAALAATSGALPLLQFAASKLWEMREGKVLTRASYEAMGGISGALATHADQVLATLAPTAQHQVRAIMLRLVTPERTRAVVERGELSDLAKDPRAIDTVVDHLVAARLLVVQAGSVEIVHESLVTTWPTLRRWLEEGHEDAAQLAQLRAAAAQWDRKGRTRGLLWRDEAYAEARRWRARYRGELPEREQTFLDAVFAVNTRAARARRGIVIGVIALLSAGVVGSAVALISIRNAEKSAAEHAARAETERTSAERARTQATVEADHAKQAERVANDRLEEIKKESAARQAAEGVAAEKGAEVTAKENELAIALAKAEKERTVAQEEATKARAATVAEKKAKDDANRLYLQEKSRREAAEKQRAKITTELPK